MINQLPFRESVMALLVSLVIFLALCAAYTYFLIWAFPTYVDGNNISFIISQGVLGAAYLKLIIYNSF